MGGGITLTKYVEAQPSYATADNEEKERLIKEADERLATYLYMCNIDQRKYGTIVSNLRSQRSLKNDEIPKTIADANCVLSNHYFNNNNYNNAKNNPKNRNKYETESKGQEKERLSLSFAQLENKCLCYSKNGY